MTATRLFDVAALADLAERSHAVIAAHQDPGGAYPASPTFSAYRGYAWLRDGSFVAEGMSRYGDTASAEAFHDWAAGVLVGRADRVAAIVAARGAGRELAPSDMLPTRFTLDGADGSDPWWDFQTDGYGMWLWAVVTHAERHGVPLERWGRAIDLACDYLVAVGDRPATTGGRSTSSTCTPPPRPPCGRVCSRPWRAARSTRTVPPGRARRPSGSAGRPSTAV